MQILSVREITESDVGHIVNYWHNLSEAELELMGADITKIPKKSSMKAFLTSQISLNIKDKETYALIWLADSLPIGHCNANPIVYGKEACLHMHLWSSENRKKGCGQKLLKQSLPYFFENLKVKTLYCEPNAKNIGPNKTLQKLGFDFILKHATTPGTINYFQEVNRWRMTKERYQDMMAR